MSRLATAFALSQTIEKSMMPPHLLHETDIGPKPSQIHVLEFSAVQLDTAGGCAVPSLKYTDDGTFP
jgi:hypothetical protein